jgi:hypothetical protein
MASYRLIEKYALNLSLNRKAGRVHLWLRGGKNDPKDPDHTIDTDVGMFAAVAALLQGDRDRSIYFDSSSHEIASGFEM